MDALELFKKVLTASAYPESAYRIEQSSVSWSPGHRLRNLLVRAMRGQNKLIAKKLPFVAVAREEGRDWPMFGCTKVGHKRLDNVQTSIERVLDEGIPEDMVECDVWRGGCEMLMNAALNAHGDTGPRGGLDRHLLDQELTRRSASTGPMRALPGRICDQPAWHAARRRCAVAG